MEAVRILFGFYASLTVLAGRDPGISREFGSEVVEGLFLNQDNCWTHRNNIALVRNTP